MVLLTANVKNRYGAKTTLLGDTWRVGAELVIHGDGLRYRWARAIRHDRPPWLCDCCI
jgi:hypothetical protein